MKQAFNARAIGHNKTIIAVQPFRLFSSWKDVIFMSVICNLYV